jgi:hypothetical protein
MWSAVMEMASCASACLPYHLDARQPVLGTAGRSGSENVD